LDLNFKDGCLLLEAVQVNIVHIEGIFSLKHLIHVFLNPGSDEWFVENIDDTGTILGFRRKNQND
jgi:hypothetical protein